MVTVLFGIPMMASGTLITGLSVMGCVKRAQGFRIAEHLGNAVLGLVMAGIGYAVSF